MEIGHGTMVNEEKMLPCVMGRRCLETGSCAWVKATLTVNAGRDGIMPRDGAAERPCSPVCAVPEQGPGRGGPRSPRRRPCSDQKRQLCLGGRACYNYPHCSMVWLTSAYFGQSTKETGKGSLGNRKKDFRFGQMITVLS